MSDAAVLRSFRIVYVAYIVYASIMTLIQATHGLHSAASPAPIPAFLICLAGLEIAAALLFLFARFEKIACAVLLAIYAVATVLTIAQGEVPAHLVLYAATALFIVAMNKAGARSELRNS